MKNVVWDGKNEFYEIDNDVYKLQSFPVNTIMITITYEYVLILFTISV